MIQLIGATLIDWGNYVRLIEKYTGKSPTKILDQYKIPSASSEAFLLSLRSINGNNVPKHLYYVFAGSLDKESMYRFVMMSAGLEISLDENATEDKFFIFSGGIDQLIILLTNYTNRSTRKSLRVFLNQMLSILEGLGIKEAFADYRKTPLDDGTFILERRK